MNKITKEELEQAVEHKLRFSFDILQFTEEERKRIVKKMSAYWPAFYDAGKNTVSSVAIALILVVYGIIRYSQGSSPVISFLTYAMCALIWIAIVGIIAKDPFKTMEDKKVFEMKGVAQWALRKKSIALSTIVLNIAYVAVAFELLWLRAWFLGVTLLLGLCVMFWLYRRRNEEIINRLEQLAKDDKDELG